MKNIALKVQDTVFEETELVLKNLTLSRNTYINEAIDFYNKYQHRKILAEKLLKEARLANITSKEILFDLDQLPDGIEKI